MAEKRNKTKRKVYRFSLLEDETHESLWNLRFTKASLGLTIALVAIIFCAIVYSLIAFTPLRTSIPGYPDASSRQMAVQNVMKVDSLEGLISRWELYSENLKRVIEGQEPLRIDSVLKRQAADSSLIPDPTALAASDTLLRKIINESDQFKVSESGRNLPIVGLHFFAPLKGTVSAGYDPALHPYVDLTAPAGTVVLSTLEGTVIYAGWTDDDMYMIQIQHPGDIVSIYKHNQKLLRGVGDKISAGAPIALVGDMGPDSSEGRLRFELWHAGDAVDPTMYISF